MATKLLADRQKSCCARNFADQGSSSPHSRRGSPPSQNQGLLASSLQTAYNLSVLPSVVTSLVQDLIEAIESRIKSCFDVQALSRDALTRAGKWTRCRVIIALVNSAPLPCLTLALFNNTRSRRTAHANERDRLGFLQEPCQDRTDTVEPPSLSDRIVGPPRWVDRRHGRVLHQGRFQPQYSACT